MKRGGVIIWENNLAFCRLFKDGKRFIQGKRQPKGGATKEQVRIYVHEGHVLLVKHIMKTQSLSIKQAYEESKRLIGQRKKYYIDTEVSDV